MELSLARPSVILQSRGYPNPGSCRQIISSQVEVTPTYRAFSNHCKKPTRSVLVRAEVEGSDVPKDPKNEVVGEEGGVVSGEWSKTLSLLSYEDLHKHFEPQLFPDEQSQEGELSDGIEPKQKPRSVPAEQGVVSGEWSKTFSLLNYEDLSAHFEPSIFKESSPPSTLIADIMIGRVWSASPTNTLRDIDHHFEDVTGLPVVNSDLVCIGVVSKKDRDKIGNLDAKVGDVMSSPPVVITPDKTVSDAAVLMLKSKVHRVPVVNETGQLVGIVTRTDIFTALEG